METQRQMPRTTRSGWLRPARLLLFSIGLATTFILSGLTASEAAAPTRPNSYSANTTIQSSQVNSDFNTIYNYLQAGVDTYSDGSIGSADLSGSLSLSDSQLATLSTTGKVNLTALQATSQATGDIIVATSSTTMVRLGSAPAGYFLKSVGVGSVPKWDILPSGGFYVGNFTRDLSAASGTTSVTGLGFSPKAVLFIGSANVADVDSFGIDNLTAVFDVYGNDNGSDDVRGYGSSFSISVHIGSGAKQEALVSAFTGDGFTLTWTKTGSPTGTVGVGYLAMRSGV